MSICKEQFIEALRDVTSADFSNIPCDDAKIEIVVSKNFDQKMNKLIKSQKKSYWNFINTTSKKVAIIFIAIIILCGSMLSVEAIRTPVINFFNDISFRYTKFNNEDRETISDNNTSLSDENHNDTKYNQSYYDENNNCITGENFKDPKINIYNKMLNTIDFFNTIEATVEVSIQENEKTTIEYYSNIDSQSAYQAVYDHGVLKSETFCESDWYRLTHIYHDDKSYSRYHLGVYKRSDTPYIPLEERIFTAEDGIPTYLYRRNVTNCPLASYSIVPQEFAYSYLKDFELWEITNENVEYLGRQCVEIKGTPSPYIEQKHNCDTFTLLVDSKTGILMNFKAIKNGQVSGYITVKKCIIDEEINMKKFDVNEYSSYKEEFWLN